MKLIIILFVSILFAGQAGAENATNNPILITIKQSSQSQSEINILSEDEVEKIRPVIIGKWLEILSNNYIEGLEIKKSVSVETYNFRYDVTTNIYGNYGYAEQFYRGAQFVFSPADIKNDKVAYFFPLKEYMKEIHTPSVEDYFAMKSHSSKHTAMLEVEDLSARYAISFGPNGKIAEVPEEILSLYGPVSRSVTFANIISEEILKNIDKGFEGAKLGILVPKSIAKNGTYLDLTAGRQVISKGGSGGDSGGGPGGGR